MPLYCLCHTCTQSEQIVRDLKQEHFSKNDVSVLFPGNKETTKAPEGAVAGGSAGGVLGGALGWIAGMGSLALPGLAPFVVAGPLFAALSGAAVGAATGGLAGALAGMGIPEIEARRCESQVLGGDILISVHARNDADIARARGAFARARGDGRGHPGRRRGRAPRRPTPDLMETIMAGDGLAAEPSPG